MLPTKKAVTLFVCNRSVQEKKPFTIAKSEKKGFVVTCPEPKCTFRMSFFKQADGHFHQVGEARTHSCDAVLPTVKRSWLRERARELFQERGVEHGGFRGHPVGTVRHLCLRRDDEARNPGVEAERFN